MSRLQDKPFAYIGISSDEDREVLARNMESHGVTWRQAFDGRDGPLHARWNVRGPGNFFVLDIEGVIRWRGNNRDIEAGRLDPVVDRLMSGVDPK